MTPDNRGTSDSFLEDSCGPRSTQLEQAEALLCEFLERHLVDHPTCTCMLPTRYALYIDKFHPTVSAKHE